MSEDREERARVYAKIAQLILQFHELHPGQTFHVEELRVFVRDQVPEIAPDSPGRILRALRLEGRLDYVILNRRDSLYQFCTGKAEPEAPEPEVYTSELKQEDFDFLIQLERDHDDTNG